MPQEQLPRSPPPHGRPLQTLKPLRGPFNVPIKMLPNPSPGEGPIFLNVFLDLRKSTLFVVKKNVFIHCTYPHILTRKRYK